MSPFTHLLHLLLWFGIRSANMTVYVVPLFDHLEGALVNV
jgi:hypothetical protein